MHALSYIFFKPIKTRLLSLSSLAFLLLLVLFALLFSANIAYCFDRSFAWDKNTEPDLAGYYIYYKNGSSGAPYDGTGADEGDSPIKIPLASLNDPDNPEYTIHGLNGTGTFYFVATAYDIYDNQSGYSGELPYQPTAPSANDDSTTVTEDSGATNIDVIGNDNFGGDGPAASDISISTGPANGVAAVDINNTLNDPTDDSIDYTPSTNFNGMDTLSYEICDGNGDCDTALLTITVTPATPTITLTGLSISGDDSVNESSNADYTATATFSDGSTQNVTGSAAWSENSAYAGINSSGKLTTSAVSGDQTVTIQADYTYNGVTETATKAVTITDVIVPVTLTSLSTSGVDSVNENSSAGYTATATFSDGSTQNVTGSAAWSENSAYADINSSGLLTTLEVSSDQTVTIQADYTYNGTTETATKVVTITDVIVPVTLTSLSISGVNSVNENSSAGYTATAVFSDGTNQNVTSSAAWSENSAYADINTSGLLTTSEVSGDTVMSIQAGYTYNGATDTATKGVSIVDVPPSNLPPSTPGIVYPSNGQNGVDLTLDIATDPFSDPDNDAHSISQWQISEQSDFGTLVVDSISNTYLTTLPVPHMVLNANQKYYVRVRFYDTYSAASNWSGIVEFTTFSSSGDLNSNGIPDANEVSDTDDLNLDGIPDNDQPDVIKSVQATDGSTYFGVEKISSAITEIKALEMIDPEAITDTANRPNDLIFGLISCRLRVNQPGAAASVRIYFSGEIFESDVYYKYDRINGWYDYSDHTTFADDGQSVIIELKDGGFGDSDGIANGIIVDPGGISAAGDLDTGLSSDGSGGGGCFIATAAFGSKFEKHVQLLRRFRDIYLVPHNIGRAFVRAYYKYSPPAADIISRHDTLRMMVRWSLAPLIGVSWMLLHFGVLHTLLLFLTGLGMLTFYGSARFRRANKRTSED
ncbi:MAG: cadherin-like domain-containing protein [Deltaproteobacteria bacterium]|nr:cadherin-like domain-containing protein [Deltaproteobacteria bacterium]